MNEEIISVCKIHSSSWKFSSFLPNSPKFISKAQPVFIIGSEVMKQWLLRYMRTKSSRCVNINP